MDLSRLGTALVTRWGAATDAGPVRRRNEDSWLAEPPRYAGADGMGGHADGAAASATALHRLAAGMRPGAVAGAGADLVDLDRAIASAAADVAALADPAFPLTAPGTTLTGALALDPPDGPHWLVFNIGDSRVYLMRSGELRQISVDHSVGSHSGKGDRPRLTRALGAGLGSPVADQWLIRARVGDRMLVCTDGLSNAVAREQLAAAMVGDDDPQETVQRLLDEALAAGGRDNVSLAVVDCLEVIQVAGGELDDVMSLDESEEETVSWNHDDTIPDPEGK